MRLFVVIFKHYAKCKNPFEIPAQQQNETDETYSKQSRSAVIIDS